MTRISEKKAVEMGIIPKPAKKNPGKAFEQDFKLSVPDDAYFLRLKDGGGWSNAENTRFTPSNECDCIIYKKPNMFMLEFKSHKGKSLPFNCISDKQRDGLKKAIDKDVMAGYIVNFRDCEKTYFIAADRVADYIAGADRASIPIEWFGMYGYEIKQQKKRTRYRYDVENMLIEVANKEAG